MTSTEDEMTPHHDAEVFPVVNDDAVTRRVPAFSLSASTIDELDPLMSYVLVKVKAAACRRQPLDVEDLVAAADLPVAQLATAIDRLRAVGLLVTAEEMQAERQRLYEEARAESQAQAEQPPPPITKRPLNARPDFGGPWPLVRGQDFPDKGVAVVYHLYRNNRLHYVGMTESLGRRLTQHALGGREFDRWRAFVCADRPSAAWYEQLCIAKLRPEVNRPHPTFLSRLAAEHKAWRR